ncbi:membrane protein insertase YidC [Aliidiomarina minuta]|uniref:Membrane protein insertase YidC n=1 Tax=Aliidiomarina minuta TaxID=880057 RepID=A0A432WA06_9GAMM|nr:membrane protein insertase YidC [Aliidiomarina minuta]RUO26983.1 membrane protein insertase YidC [Aliidiomarina minuta]
MGSQRSILIIALLVVSFFLYQQWLIRDASTTPGVDGSSAPEPTYVLPEAADDSAASSTVPGQTATESSGESLPTSPDIDSGEIIRVQTDVLDVEIDLRGGDLVDAKLLKFAERQGEAERFNIMHRKPGHIYIAQSGLIGRDGTDTGDSRPVFTAPQSAFNIENQETLSVPLTYVRDDGTEIIKTYTFSRGDYAVNVSYDIRNATDEVKRMALYGQLKQSMVSDSGSMFMPTYRGAAYSTQDTRYDKYSFSNIESRNLNENTMAGWVAMLEHYFVTAWVPNQQENNRLYTNATRHNEAMIGFVGETVQVPAQGEARIEANLFLGPKDQSRLAELANNLDLTVDYGFMWWLAQPMFALMSFFYSLVANWGVVIIMITLTMKLLLYPLTKAQYTSMAKMRMVAPKMKELKEKYGDDRQKMSQAMMKMYKEEKVNPLGGCLPMILQLPIFLTLYWVLLESAEFRHADFALWITDLSSRDPYFILPLLMGGSMWLMQRLQPTPMTDPMQKKLMQMMPILFTVFFLFFPSGLVLYWLVSNLVSIAQMLWIYRQIERKGLKGKKEST